MHENSVNDPKTYFVKGQIYQGIFESPLADYKKLDPNALDVAYEAYQKALQLDDKDKFGKKLKTQYNNLIVDYTNKAIDCYNTQDFKCALDAFKKVLEIENSDIVSLPVVDTATIFNTAVTALKAEAYPDAEKYFREALKYNYEPGKTYAMLVQALKAQNKKEDALEVLKKGYELYPNDANMLVELINYYLLGGEPEKAETYLDAAIKQDPGNASFYRAKGTLYEKMKELDKAAAMYEKALSVDPKDFISQYNLGMVKLTEAIDYHNKVNEIVDVDEYNEAIKKVYDAYGNVVPYFEKALELSPNDKNTLITLKELYFKLRNNSPDYEQKYEKVKALLDQE